MTTSLLNMVRRLITFFAAFTLLIFAAVPAHSRTWQAASFPGPDASSKINAAIRTAASGDTVDLSGFTGTQILSEQVLITKSLRFTNCRTQFIEAMPDPGIQPNGGGINVQADGVTFIGKAGCEITQANGANIQALIQSGSSTNITFSRVKFDGNEGNQNDVNGYYSCWRASTGTGGGGNLKLTNSEITGCGDRATDWRGVTGAYQLDNYCHQSGVNIAGRGLARGGDCLHVDVDGATLSGSVWQMRNTVDEWGDSAIAAPNSVDCHMVGNVIHGQAYYGHPFQSVQGGLDLSGCMNASALGNEVYDVRGEVLGMTCGTTGAETTNSSNVVARGNLFVETAPAATATIPQAKFGSIGYVCNPTNYVVEGNTFWNVTLTGVGISGLVVNKNNFYFDGANNGNFSAIDLSGEMTNFSIKNNTTTSIAMGDLRDGINIQGSVTNPAPCFIGNEIYSNLLVSNYVVWQMGAKAACQMGAAFAK